MEHDFASWRDAAAEFVGAPDRVHRYYQHVYVVAVHKVGNVARCARFVYSCLERPGEILHLVAFRTQGVLESLSYA